MECLGSEGGEVPAPVAHYAADISKELEQKKHQQTGRGHLCDAHLPEMTGGEQVHCGPLSERRAAPLAMMKRILDWVSKDLDSGHCQTTC